MIFVGVMTVGGSVTLGRGSLDEVALVSSSVTLLLSLLSLCHLSSCLWLVETGKSCTLENERTLDTPLDHQSGSCTGRPYRVSSFRGPYYRDYSPPPPCVSCGAGCSHYHVLRRVPCCRRPAPADADDAAVQLLYTSIRVLDWPLDMFKCVVLASRNTKTSQT